MTSSSARPLCGSFEQTQWEGARLDHPCSSSVGALSSTTARPSYFPWFSSIRCTNEWECWNVKYFSRWIAFFHSHKSVVSSVEYMLKIRSDLLTFSNRWVSPRLNVIPAPPRIVFIVLSPFEKSAWSIPVSRYLMRRITQFLQVLWPRTNISLSFSSSVFKLIDHLLDDSPHQGAHLHI